MNTATNLHIPRKRVDFSRLAEQLLASALWSSASSKADMEEEFAVTSNFLLCPRFAYD
jgi:hypothetical protein